MKQIDVGVKVNGRQRTSSVWWVPDGYLGESAVIVAHGAGNDMHSELVSAMHERWSDAGLMAVKFNFPYKERGSRLPDRADVLIDTWRAVADSVMNDPGLAPRNVFYAGKSLGGRIASMLAAGETNPAGVIFLGYPLHPAGKPEKLRVNHLGRVASPMLFIQGTRDALCDLSILARVLDDLGDGKNELYRLEGADHSFEVLKKLKRDPADVRNEIAQRALEFIRVHTG